MNNVEFVQGEMEDMPLPDGSVDVVISNCVICLSPDKGAVFSEAFRVLAPGGRMHISDMMALSLGGLDPSDTRAWVSCVAGAEDRETYVGRLQDAGFADVEMTDETLKYDDEGVPSNVISVKVLARKPR